MNSAGNVVPAAIGRVFAADSQMVISNGFSHCESVQMVIWQPKNPPEGGRITLFLYG
jgi:hypothetical protein